MPLRDIDCVVLCGGKGTRARSYLGDTPKVLAPIKGRPFIDHLLGYLWGYGARRFNLLAHHGIDQIRGWATGVPEYRIHIWEDRHSGLPLVLRDAADVVTKDQLLILNGDTLLRGDLSKLLVNVGHWSMISFTVKGVPTGIVLAERDYVQRGGTLSYLVEVIAGFDFLDIGTPEGYAQAEAFVSQADMADREHSIV